MSLKVSSVGGVEKWEDRKCVRMKKCEDRKYFNFPPFCLVGSGKIEG